MFSELKRYSVIPDGEWMEINVVDSAGNGSDFFCAYHVLCDPDFNVGYVKDIFCTDEVIRKSIPMFERWCVDNDIHVIEIEDNSIGSVFVVQLERDFKDMRWPMDIQTHYQKKNKVQRILDASTAIADRLYFREEAGYVRGGGYDIGTKQLLSYKKKQKKNDHDDSPDVAARVIEKMSAGGAYGSGLVDIDNRGY